VKANTKVSTLQWNVLLEHLSGMFGQHRAVGSFLSDAASANLSSCEADSTHRALLQTSLAILGPNCEEMCKKTGSYPNCQCPGFGGTSSSEGDERACIEKYCQDPSTPCPTEDFISCVKANTKVSTLQWDALLQRVSRFVTAYKSMASP
jgi:hypothetical protein